MSGLEHNTNPQFVNGEAGALQLVDGGQYQPEPNINIDDLLSTAKNVIKMDEFPDDKIVKISMEWMVVPKAINIIITKK